MLYQASHCGFVVGGDGHKDGVDAGGFGLFGEFDGAVGVVVCSACDDGAGFSDGVFDFGEELETFLVGHCGCFASGAADYQSV